MIDEFNMKTDDNVIINVSIMFYLVSTLMFIVSSIFFYLQDMVHL